MIIIKYLSCIVAAFFCAHAAAFLFFYLAPLKTEISSITALKISGLYKALGQPTYEIPEKGIIAWEACSRTICKTIEARIAFESRVEDQYPRSIKVKNIYNGETRFFEKFKISSGSETSEYITIWPYGTFCVASCTPEAF